MHCIGSTPTTQALGNSTDALKYLQGHGLTSSEMVDHLQLGLASRTLGYGLPEKNRAAGAELRGRLQKLGIFPETGHEPGSPRSGCREL
jgi:hypothetical protein